MFTEQQAIRAILDAATKGDLSAASKALNDYADQRPGTGAFSSEPTLNKFGQQYMQMEEVRSRLPINALP